MNSYELLKPAGAGTGIWACGECHKPHVGAWRAPTSR
jgi:ribosomal protein L37AE/L43A